MITIDNLTNSRIEVYDYIYEMNVIKLLNLCAYFKDKQKEEQRQLELIQMRNGR